MKIENPPSPCGKQREGGFETYFWRKKVGRFF
jgi:hypothetical protein